LPAAATAAAAVETCWFELESDIILKAAAHAASIVFCCCAGGGIAAAAAAAAAVSCWELAITGSFVVNVILLKGVVAKGNVFTGLLELAMDPEVTDLVGAVVIAERS